MKKLLQNKTLRRSFLALLWGFFSLQVVHAQCPANTWVSRTSAADNQWLSVTYGNGLFVAVSISGIGNRVMTSPDGITWTIRTSVPDNDWRSVTYGNGLFVAVSNTGTGNRVMTSPDGITWTIRTSAADNSWQSVTYGNGLFVAMAINGTGNSVMTSPDGITWTIRTSAADNEWRSVTYGNGVFVAVAQSGTGNRVMTSPDGINWTIRTAAADNSWQSVTYGNGLFVAVAFSGIATNKVMTSPDGINWTIRTAAANNSWFSVTYANGLFVAVSTNGANNSVMTSPDGINWTSRTSAANNNWTSITYGNGLFVAVSLNGSSNRVMTCTTPFTTSTTNVSICSSALAYSWNGTAYNVAGTYTKTFTGGNSKGCDSVATLVLTVVNASVVLTGGGATCGNIATASLTATVQPKIAGTAYAWYYQAFNETNFSNTGTGDSILSASNVLPAQYYVAVSIPGCGNYTSNQQAVVPVAKPNLSLNPSPITSICENNVITFSATTSDVDTNNYAFYVGSTLLQKDTLKSYTTPILTAANNNSIYTLEAVNGKPNFDGTINENYWGIPMASSIYSNVIPGFGAGQELNALYARADSNYIYLAIAGNVQNQNRIMVFMDSKAGGYNNGNYGRGGGISNNAIGNFNSATTFDAGFNADYCLGIGTDATRSQFYFDLVTLSGTVGNGGGPSNYIGSNLNPESSYKIGANPVNGSQTNGFEIAIPKADIGYTGGDIKVFAMYIADNGFLSNQFLTRANTGAGNYGSGAINFGAAAPNPISIPVESFSNTCKSTASTTVKIKAVSISTTNQTICPSALPFTWNGLTFNNAGIQTAHLFNAMVCDSSATLNLIVDVIPATPTVTVSSIAVLTGQINVAYTCSSVVGATNYQWSYTGAGATITGNGTTSITVNFASNATSGVMKVKAINANGCESPEQTVAITVPVILSSFSAEKVSNTALLKWITKTEINSKNFEVQRSTDGSNFETIGTVAAKGFGSDYSFVDDKPFVGINYYRLKMVDIDGKFEISVVKSLNIKSETLNVSIYPNPVDDVLNIKITNGEVKQVRIFNTLGKTMYQSTNNRTSHIINLKSFIKGTYFVEIITNEAKVVERFLKN